MAITRLWRTSDSREHTTEEAAIQHEKMLLISARITKTLASTTGHGIDLSAFSSQLSGDGPPRTLDFARLPEFLAANRSRLLELLQPEVEVGIEK
jgi:hypothetical protein